MADKSKSVALDRLQQFEEAGWITPSEAGEYTVLLDKENGLDMVFSALENCNNVPTVQNPAQFYKSNKSTNLDKIFVEMCFFARLGFVQPPKCLQCAYRKSTIGCQRPVVWRQDANQLLDPDTIQDNIVVISCRTAVSLLKGKTVDGWTWQSSTHQLEQLPAVP